MEININCDLGEKSKLHSNERDPDLLKIVNSANIACGYHAGDKETMNDVIKISKNNGVSIGAHPSFKDPDNFGRERMNLRNDEIKKLNLDHRDFKSEIESNQKKYEQLIDEATDQISNFVKKAKLDNLSQ